METEARPKKRIGRPPKPPEERSLTRTFKVPPELWREVEQYVPRGERSAAIQEALRRTVARYRRRRQEDDETAKAEYRECAAESAELAREFAPIVEHMLAREPEDWS